jgi:CO/xanthine dehydrogenase FAD-binding subunit
MKPAPFKYFAPSTVDEALNHLAEYGYDAKILAGGQSLIPTMNFRMAQPAVLIDLNNVSELFYVKNESDGLRIGAMTRQREMESNPLVSNNSPLIYEAMPFIAHPQIRNRGTVGGSIAHADPAAELPAVMIALGARFGIRSKNGERRVPANEFFQGMFTTALEAEEILTEIFLPDLGLNCGWAFREVARRRGDFALVGAAAVVDLNNDKKCQQARLVLLSVGDGPVEAHEAEQVLLGQEGSDKLVDETAEIAATKDIDPPGDIHASPEYRRHLARVLIKQVLSQAFERAQRVQ